MTNIGIDKQQRRSVDLQVRSLLFLSGAVLGIALATACHVAQANSTRRAEGSAFAERTTVELPKSSRERMPEVVRQSRDSVCLIEGTYTFRDRITGEVLRRNQWFVPGNDDVLENPFSGTGFLASPEGGIVTNKHVAQPWSSDEEAQRILSKGNYRPVLTKLIAYFPGLPQPLPLRLARVARRDDAAILVADPGAALPRPLPLAPENNTTPGARVLLMGYPAGVRAILARNRVNLDRIIATLSARTDEQISRTLATRHAIEPFTSVGYVSNFEPNVLTISALVTDGSSGSPVLNEDGQVVGVMRASLTRVEGATLAVPAAVVRQLLADSQ